MTREDLTRSTGTRAATAVAALGVVVLLAAIVSAVRGETAPPASAAPVGALAPLTRVAAAPGPDISAAVENDLFSPDRTAPASAYRMPGEDAADDGAAEEARPSVLGTAVATDGRHFATVKLSDGSPTLVHVGDRIGTWVVRAIERGKVTFAGADGTRIDVTAPKPGI